jgi:hypothetical protein
VLPTGSTHCKGRIALAASMCTERSARFDQANLTHVQQLAETVRQCVLPVQAIRAPTEPDPLESNDGAFSLNHVTYAVFMGIDAPMLMTDSRVLNRRRRYDWPEDV